MAAKSGNRKQMGSRWKGPSVFRLIESAFRVPKATVCARFRNRNPPVCRRCRSRGDRVLSQEAGFVVGVAHGPKGPGVADGPGHIAV
jgi:hypothetical protein